MKYYDAKDVFTTCIFNENMLQDSSKYHYQYGGGFVIKILLKASD
jgi:hypothetical protein